MNILNRLESLMKQRGLNERELSLRSGIPPTTINSWFRREYNPSIFTLESLCEGLGITLSEVFYEGDSDCPLTQEQRELLAKWSRLSPEQKQAFLRLIDSL